MTTVQAASKDPKEKGHVRPPPAQVPDEREKTGKPPEAAPVVAGVNLQKLADEELIELRRLLDAEISGRQQKATANLVAELRAKAQKLGLDPATIAAMLSPAAPRSRRGSGEQRARLPPKYRNPADPSRTWAGRGIKPKWIELGPDGKPLAKFLIPQASQ